MTQATNTIPVYLEVGQKRTFAGAINWPGWCRAARDEAAALQALFDYGPRYATVLQAAHIPFLPPATPAALVVTERLTGTSTTDFGAPDMAPSSDAAPMDEADLQRLQAMMQAAWQALDAAVEDAAGKELRKGPRGGGRNLDKIVHHVVDAEAAYIRRLAWKIKKQSEETVQAKIAHIRQEALSALAAAARGELPTQGPRGGAVWAPRYFVRRAVWHTLDHAWEITDRVQPE